MSARIDESAIVAYDDSDTRYTQNIKYLDRYTHKIYPLHFREKCKCRPHIDNIPDNVPFDNKILQSSCTCKLVDGECNPFDENYQKKECQYCFAEGYEHCQDPRHNGNCQLDLYGRVESTIEYPYLDIESGVVFNTKNNTINTANLRNSKSTIYDRTRVHKSDGLHIMRSPDIGNSEGFIGNIGGNIVGGIGGGLGNVTGGIAQGLGNITGGFTNALGSTLKGFGDALGLDGISNELWLSCAIICFIFIMLSCSMSLAYLSQLQ
jgi:hypothetical protein